MKTFAAEFVRGAVRPSAPALLGAIGVAVGCAVMAMRAITPERIAALPPTTFVQDETDRHGLVSARALAVGHGPYQRDAVAVLGASTTLHAITGEAALADMLSTRLGRPVPAHLLCAPGLRAPELNALATALNGKVGGAVVINVSVSVLFVSRSRYAELIQHPKLALDLPELGSARPLVEGTRPARTGVFFLDHLAWFERRLPAAALRGFRPFGAVLTHPQQFDPRDPADVAKREKRLEEQLAEWREVLNTTHRRFARAEVWLRVLAEIIQREQERSDAAIVLLESTRSEVFRATVDEELLAAYDASIRKLADGLDVSYWNLQQEAGLRDGDFADLTHVGVAEARERYTRILADRLAPLLEGRER